MTRYVGEPSPEKKLSQQRSLVESLARRPAPPVGASGGAPSYAYGFSYINAQAVAAGGSKRLPIEDFYTNALGSVFSTGGAITPGDNTTGDLYLHFHAAGLYIVYADVFWDHAAYARTSWVDTTCVQFNQQELNSGGEFNEKETGNSDPLQDRMALYNFVDQYTLTNSPSYYHRVSTLVYNEDAASRDVLYSTIAAVYWPMEHDFQNTPDTDLIYES